MQDHIIVATFIEDGDRDHEVFGPFATHEAAALWADHFTAWFDSLDGSRTLDHLLFTQMSMPFTMNNMPLPQV